MPSVFLQSTNNPLYNEKRGDAGKEMKKKSWLCVIVWVALLVLSVGCNARGKETPSTLVQAADSEDGYATVYVPDDRPAKVLLIADPQLDPTHKYKIEGSSNKLTITFLEKLIDAADPDFVIIAGDLAISGFHNNWQYFCTIADIFEERQLPWTFVFGNHDCQSWAVSKLSSKYSIAMQMTKPKFIEAVHSRYQYCLIYSGPCEDGYGNHVVNVRNTQGKLLNTFINLDCVYNNEDESGGSNALVSQEQTDYYASVVESLSAAEGHTIPSILVRHVMLQEARTGWQRAKQKKEDSTIYWGNCLEWTYTKQKVKSPIFNTIKRLGSTKAIFFGHDHSNDGSVEYQGIRMTFIPHSGMAHNYRVEESIAFRRLFWDRDTVFDFTKVDRYGDKRGGILLTIEQDTTYTFEPYYAADHIPEYADFAIDYDAVAARIVKNRGERAVIRGKKA